MIVTHTQNAQGHRRVYLGGKASVECWIEPAVDGIGWSFHLNTAPTRYPLSDDAMRGWAQQVLFALAAKVGTQPEHLKAVPFERIAALHTKNPDDYGRAPAPRRQADAHAFTTTPPEIYKTDKNSHSFSGHRIRR